MDAGMPSFLFLTSLQSVLIHSTASRGGSTKAFTQGLSPRNTLLASQAQSILPGW